jgi:hypothetical protein
VLRANGPYRARVVVGASHKYGLSKEITGRFALVWFNYGHHRGASRKYGLSVGITESLRASMV